MTTSKGELARAVLLEVRRAQGYAGTVTGVIHGTEENDSGAALDADRLTNSLQRIESMLAQFERTSDRLRVVYDVNIKTGRVFRLGLDLTRGDLQKIERAKALATSMNLAAIVLAGTRLIVLQDSFTKRRLPEAVYQFLDGEEERGLTHAKSMGFEANLHVAKESLVLVTSLDISTPLAHSWRTPLEICQMRLPKSKNRKQR